MNNRRKLLALMFTDIVGYSALAARDEGLAMQAVSDFRQIIRSLLIAYGGTEIDTVGDGLFAQFESAVCAVECAIEIQKRIKEHNQFTPDDAHFGARVGLHLGDVIAEEHSFFGNAVNIAARVQGIAPKGGIALTHALYSQVEDKISADFKRLGKISLKNIPQPQEIFVIESKDHLARRSFEQVFRAQFIEPGLRFMDALREKPVQLGIVILLFLIAAGITERSLHFSLESEFVRGMLSRAPASAGSLEDILRLATLPMALVMSAVCLVLFVFQSHRRKTLYLSLYLFLSAGPLLSRNTMFTGFENEPLRQFIDWNADAMGSALMCSALLALKRHRRLELLNIFFAFLFLAASVVLIDFSLPWPHELYSFVGIYTLTWVSFTSLDLLEGAKAIVLSGGDRFYKTLAAKLGRLTMQASAAFIGWVLFASIAATAFPALLGSHPVVARLTGLAKLISPFMISLALIGIGLCAYIRQSHREAYRTRKEKARSFISSFVRQNLPRAETLERVHAEIASFIGAERSSLLTVDSTGTVAVRNMVCPSSARHFIEKRHVDAEGVLRYVMSSRLPIVTANIHDDFRFQGYFNKRGESSFKTGSCIIYPLLVHGDLIGILTFADKNDLGIFSANDLEFINETASDLLLLLARVPGETISQKSA
jgi:class 3 adenylate cyclase